MKKLIIIALLFSLTAHGQADSTKVNQKIDLKTKVERIIKSDDMDRLDKEFALADISFNLALGFDPAVRLREELKNHKKQNDDKRKHKKVD